jgi:phospholipid/cholesterol/gamma-HCH transport system ATP-binding protein
MAVRRYGGTSSGPFAALRAARDDSVGGYRRSAVPPFRLMIILEQLTKSFGSRTVLSGVSLDVPDGQNTVIIGSSGAGKSVTLKLIVGLLEPDGGRVLVDDEDVQELDRDQLAALRGRIGYVFQFAALFDSMTVADNIRLGLVKRGFGEAVIRERVEESLAVVDLTGTDTKMPSELSGGMRKRVGIARAIALKPRYILYDEPTTGLDPVTAAVMDQLIMRTRDLGVTGLVVTHDMRSAFTVGDRIAMLHQGSIRQTGTAEEMRSSSDPVVRQFIEGRPGPELVLSAMRRSVG